MMKKLLQSPLVAWGVLLLVVVLLIATFGQCQNWWSFTPFFFLFMMAFAHAISLMIAKFNKFAAKRLDLIALVMGIAGVLAAVVVLLI